MSATRKRLRNAGVSLFFCGPAVALYCGFIILPALMGFGYSLTDWSGWVTTPDFIGLDNFRELAGDERFVHAVKFTLFETVLIMAFFTFATMVLAILLDNLKSMKGLIRGLFFYPYVLSILVSALLFRYLANYRHGAVNIVLRGLLPDVTPEFWTAHPGWSPYLLVYRLMRAEYLDLFVQDWMGAANLAPYFIFALVVWSGMGFFTTLYLANLQTIPTHLYEAARIDGAGPIAVFRHIQFPMLLPTITTNSVLALITGINLFPQIVVTTFGNPGYRTFSIGFYIYHLGVLSNRQGYAAAVSFVTFAALLIVAAIQVALLRRRQVNL
ncbi:MAG: sugar ABC transporter permease [bacterium]|nr:sugar ABC transporter permease [bacterium]